MLTGKQKRYLRGLASLLNPVAIVGKEGFRDEVVAEIANGLKANELVKIKISKNSLEDMEQIIEMVAKKNIGEVIQIIGKTIVLYKQNKKDIKIILPQEVYYEN